MGDREKYSANPRTSLTTLTTFGSAFASLVSIGVQTVDMRSAGSSRKGSMAASIVSGSMSGSSPWTLTMRSQSSLGRDFGKSIGAREVLGARHPHGAAESGDRVGDSMIVGRDDHGIDVAGRRRTAIHVLDHRPPRDVGQRLPRKTGRRVAGGDDSDSMFMVLKRIADAN